MKRLLALFLAVIMLAMLMFGCDSGPDANNDGIISDIKESIPSDVTGIWYAPESKPVLDIKDDGTGTVTVGEDVYEAEFTAADSKFSVNSSVCRLDGTYTISDDMMTVITNLNGTEYTVIFTREPVVIPEELQGTHVYMIDEDGYELNVRETGGGTCSELPYPPSEPVTEVDVYYIPDRKTPEIPTLKTYVLPELIITTGESTEESSSTEPTEDIDIDIDIPGGTTLEFVPEIIYIENTKIICVFPGSDEKTETTKGGGSLVGTWTSEPMDGQAYIFGTTSEFTSTITYTFNADGTGSILAMGIIPGTLTYTLTGHRLDLTVSMLGQVESGTGYVTIIGDVCYIQNIDGEIAPITRIG